MNNTRVNLPQEESFEADIDQIENTLREQIRATQLDIIPEYAASQENSYVFQKEQPIEAEVLTQELKLDSFTEDSMGFTRQYADFNIWDVTDPKIMKLSKLKRNSEKNGSYRKRSVKNQGNQRRKEGRKTARSPEV